MTDKGRIDIWNRGFYYALQLVKVKIRNRQNGVLSYPEEGAYLNVLDDIDYIMKDRAEDMENMEFDENGKLIGEDKK